MNDYDELRATFCVCFTENINKMSLNDIFERKIRGFVQVQVQVKIFIFRDQRIARITARLRRSQEKLQSCDFFTKNNFVRYFEFLIVVEVYCLYFNVLSDT